MRGPAHPAGWRAQSALVQSTPVQSVLVLAALLVVAALLVLASPMPVSAQGLQGPVLVIDRDRLFSESAFGRRVAAELEAESRKLEAENRRLEKALQDEEQALTDERARLTPEAFRPLADAFDDKVQRFRREQNAKARALQNRSDRARGQFLQAAQAALESLMQDSGAVMILDQRAVFVAVSAVDITEAAVARIDVAIGPGAGLPPELPLDMADDPDPADKALPPPSPE